MNTPNILAACVALASPLAAATVTVNGTIDNATDTASIGAFDQSLSTLQSAVLTYESTGRVIFDGRCTARVGNPCSVTVGGSLELFLNGPSGIIDSTSGSNSETATCAVRPG